MPVLVAPDGNVVKVYPNPDVERHAREVLDDLDDRIRAEGPLPEASKASLRPPAEKLHQILPGGVANPSDERAVGCDQRSVYAREGVGHLWLVDPTDRTLEAFELHDGQWLLIASAKDDDSVSIRPFDAITFSLSDLWP